MEGVETSLDRTLQPDFEENPTIPPSSLGGAKEVDSNEADRTQLLTHDGGQDRTTEQQPSTVHGNKESFVDVGGGETEKKEDATCNEGSKLDSAHGDSSTSTSRTEEAGSLKTSTDEVTTSRTTESREEGASEMEVVPASSRAENGGENVAKPQTCQLVATSAQPGDTQSETDCRKHLATSDTISAGHQLAQDGVSLNSSSFVPISRDSSAAPVHEHSPQTTSSITTGAQLKSSNEDSCESGGNLYRNTTVDVSKSALTTERTTTSQSTPPIEPHEESQPSQLTPKVHSTSHLPDWDEKPTGSSTDQGQRSHSMKQSSLNESASRETEVATRVDMKPPSETQVDPLSCRESLEEEDVEKSSSTVKAPQQPSSSQHAGRRASTGTVHERAHREELRHSKQEHTPHVEQPTMIGNACMGNSSTSAESSIYVPQNHTHTHTPWFSLFPRDLCEAIQVAYVNNQAVLLESAYKQQQQQQQQQQQVQHVLATDASGNQYIMAAPTAASTATAAAAAAPQYAYMTPDGQIIPAASAAAAGQNQVIQQVTGMSYALVGNTLVQVPQTQYVAVNASGQQFVVAGQPGQQQQQQAGVQYVAVSGNTAASAQTAVQVGGQQQLVQAQQSQEQQKYVAVVEREGGGQMLVQVGAAPETPAVQASGVGAGGSAVAIAGAQQQYIVQTAGDPSTASALVAAAQAQAHAQAQALQAQAQAKLQGTTSNAVDGSSSNLTASKTQYGIVNSDGTITVITEEDLAKYNVAVAGASSPVKEATVAGTSTASGQPHSQAAALQQQTQQHSFALNNSTASAHMSSASGSSRNMGGEEGRVKVEIDVPNQYPKVYIKTEEEEERMEESALTLVSRQAAILGQTVVQDQNSALEQEHPSVDVSAGQMAVVEVQQPGGSQGGVAGQLHGYSDNGAAVVQGGQTAESATMASDDTAGQHAAAQVRFL